MSPEDVLDALNNLIQKADCNGIGRQVVRYLLVARTEIKYEIEHG